MSNEPTRPRRFGLRDIMVAALLLLGIMLAASLAIAVAVFLILVLLHVLAG